MQGNCLSLPPGCHRYDRIYCGAACDEEYLDYLKELMKVGGILVVPINERLVEIKRIDETNWSTNYFLPVSFTNLVNIKSLENLPLCKYNTSESDHFIDWVRIPPRRKNFFNWRKLLSGCGC